jgi:hypothetical protein
MEDKTRYEIFWRNSVGDKWTFIIWAENFGDAEKIAHEVTNDRDAQLFRIEVYE